MNKKIYIVPDMSHYQIDVPLANEWLESTPCPYLFLKASEGETYKDNKILTLLDKFATNHIRRGTGRIVIGLYHFCRLDNKNGMQTASERAKAEMKNFFQVINTVRDYLCNEYGGSIRVLDIVPILDWEAKNLTQPNRANYLITCIEECMKICGTQPMLYCSASVTGSNECKVVRATYPSVPLWVAHYNKDKPRVSYWTEWTAWQFTSAPFDLSFVRDTIDTFVVKHINKVLLEGK